MSDRLALTMHNAQQGHQAMEHGWKFAKAHLMAGRAMEVSIKPARRTVDQNARLHASIADIAEQCMWGGRKWDIESWKRLLTAAWCRANAEGVEIVPAVDGQGFDVLYRRTSKLTRAECADLCEYVYAWGTDHGVKFSAPENMKC